VSDHRVPLLIGRMRKCGARTQAAVALLEGGPALNAGAEASDDTLRAAAASAEGFAQWLEELAEEARQVADGYQHVAQQQQALRARGGR
jgi:hypothetical protein